MEKRGWKRISRQDLILQAMKSCPKSLCREETGKSSVHLTAGGNALREPEAETGHGAPPGSTAPS